MPLGSAWVRPTGLKGDGFVVFDFSLGDEDVTVELVLPLRLLPRFLEERRAAVRAGEPAATRAALRARTDRPARASSPAPAPGASDERTRSTR